MSVFVDLKIEPIVQVSDKTRLDASRSFVAASGHTITKIEISPEGASPTYIDVGDELESGFLDWAYASAGDKIVTVRITATQGMTTTEYTTTKTLTVVTAAVDALLSTDQDILSLESDVLEYLPKGHNSWIFMHRKAQSLILDYLDKNGYRDSENLRLTKTAIVEKEEYRTWSKFMVLRLIFFDLSNQPNDHFWEKSKFYEALEDSARTRISLPIDLDGDGTVDPDTENVRFDTIVLRVR